MDFAFENWGQAELDVLEKYLKSIAHPENAEWENRIVRTSYPLLSTYTKVLRAVAKSIARGNALAFLNLHPSNFHEEIVLQGLVLCELKDAREQMRLLPTYLKLCDSWAQTDSLKFRITNKNADEWFNYATNLTRSQNTFERRCGLLIYFKFLTTDRLENVFDAVKALKNDEEYYVNMAIAWLVCEAFIKRRDETLALLRSDALSPWTQNKAISKCRDSFRVSHEDKALLLSLKK
ncbi:MAG: DNA alkylation repair protein [Clostridia bacterium]|nr:DNA alkylation repair protein [Clostridia bacterium]